MKPALIAVPELKRVTNHHALSPVLFVYDLEAGAVLEGAIEVDCEEGWCLYSRKLCQDPSCVRAEHWSRAERRSGRFEVRTFSDKLALVRRTLFPPLGLPPKP